MKRILLPQQGQLFDFGESACFHLVDGGAAGDLFAEIVFAVPDRAVKAGRHRLIEQGANDLAGHVVNDHREIVVII